MGRQGRSRAIGWYASPHIICVCVAVLLALASVESMTMEVDHGEQQCVIVNLSKATTINANYEVRSVTRILNSTPLLAGYVSRVLDLFCIVATQQPTSFSHLFCPESTPPAQ